MSSAKAQGLKTLGIEMDDLGLVPEDLDQKLENWGRASGRKPFVLYMIPTGQNPTGTTQSLQRRKAIYDIAERHDLYILEDDPYYFLQVHHAASGLKNKPRVGVETAEEYIKSLPASYLSMDTSGRVLRMDTASKILAPGLRIYKRAHDNGVLVSKGSWFSSDVDATDEIYFRLTFATAPAKELAEAVERFADAVRSEVLHDQSLH
ncbi:hypothetical protein INS49_013337 [Diaporthe citri]|uniref:uncharacterized protein n=1 Tax=Diaporthe citri TaxID=83186 RepID=UPI001C7F1AD3|nr:uncharacterized protein INS49_013337 [Diaporthe citri]KAG6357460.1 hypothetical protein INS49_013337 [Diaporthe citri]